MLLALSLLFAIRIVTFYEITQGLMRFLAVLFVLLGLALAYIGSIGLVFTGIQSQRVPMEDGLRISIDLASGCTILLGFLLVAYVTTVAGLELLGRMERRVPA